MGGCVSSPSQDASALDLALAQRLKTYISTHPEVHAAKSLHRVALNFGSMLKSFEALRVGFTRIDTDHNGRITWEEFISACGELKFKQNENNELLKEVYSTADVNDDGHVDFREFVTALTLAYLIHEASAKVRGGGTGDTTGDTDENKERLTGKEGSKGLDKTVSQLRRETEAERLTHTALDKVLEAWLIFDPKGSGFIQKKNVHAALASFSSETEKGKVGASSKLINSRFGEMNFGSNNAISFQEFLYAIEGWCGMGDEE